MHDIEKLYKKREKGHDVSRETSKKTKRAQTKKRPGFYIKKGAEESRKVIDTKKGLFQR